MTELFDLRKPDGDRPELRDYQAHCSECALAVENAYARLRSVLESTADGVISLERSWTIRYANQRALEVLPDLVIGRSYWSCFPAVIGTPLEQLMRTSMDTGGESSYVVFYDPYQRWFKGRIVPDDSGISLFFSDCTEEKWVADQLDLERTFSQHIEARCHMAGSLANEIATSLVTIQSLATNLETLTTGEQGVSKADVVERCGDIAKTCDRAIRIFNEIEGFLADVQRTERGIPEPQAITDAGSSSGLDSENSSCIHTIQ